METPQKYMNIRFDKYQDPLFILINALIYLFFFFADSPLPMWRLLTWNKESL